MRSGSSILRINPDWSLFPGYRHNPASGPGPAPLVMHLISIARLKVSLCSPARSAENFILSWEPVREVERDENCNDYYLLLMSSRPASPSITGPDSCRTGDFLLSLLLPRISGENKTVAVGHNDKLARPEHNSIFPQVTTSSPSLTTLSLAKHNNTYSSHRWWWRPP